MVSKMGSIFSNQNTGNKKFTFPFSHNQNNRNLAKNHENWVLIDTHVHNNHEKNENEGFIVKDTNIQDNLVSKKQKIGSLVNYEGSSSLNDGINQNYENEGSIVKDTNIQDNHVLKKKKIESFKNYEGSSSLIGRINHYPDVKDHESEVFIVNNRKKRKIKSFVNNESTSSLNDRIGHYSNGQNHESEGFIDCVGENGGLFNNVASCSGNISDIGCRSNRACRNEGLIDILAPCGGRKLGLGGNLSSTDRVSEKNGLREDKDLGEKMASFRDHKLGLSGIVDCSNGSSNRVMEKEGLRDGIGINMVDELYLKYERIKKCALGTLRYYKEESKDDSVTEVIHLDNESDNDGIEVIESKEFGDSYREAFAPLTNEEEDEVSRAFSAFNQNEVLITHENSNTDITRGVLQCLRPGGWLNDEVINVYFSLLKEREMREPDMFLKCHFFHTLFYEKLIGGKIGYDFKSVRRWTTQTKLGYNLSECDKIFVPIHKQAHWCLAVINKKDQKFQYLDPLRGIDTEVLSILAIYYADELKDKNGVDIDVASWTEEYVEDIPVQQNGWDCGMFMIKYADFYSRGLGLSFNQEHMPYFRLRTTKEILKLEAK